MKYSIVYSSRTGNTGMLAQKLKDTLPGTDCVYCGIPQEKIPEADLVFAGFWTSKGDCDEAAGVFLESLRGKKVFLFGTAGFGGSETYFSNILSRVRSHLDDSNEVDGAYMCQGKMPLSVRQRYETMLPKEPEKMQEMIDNFDRALPHPDPGDLERLERAVTDYMRSSGE